MATVVQPLEQGRSRQSHHTSNTVLLHWRLPICTTSCTARGECFEMEWRQQRKPRANRETHTPTPLSNTGKRSHPAHLLQDIIELARRHQCRTHGNTVYRKHTPRRHVWIVVCCCLGCGASSSLDTSEPVCLPASASPRIASLPAPGSHRGEASAPAPPVGSRPGPRRRWFFLRGCR